MDPGIPRHNLLIRGARLGPLFSLYIHGTPNRSCATRIEPEISINETQQLSPTLAVIPITTTLILFLGGHGWTQLHVSVGRGPGM